MLTATAAARTSTSPGPGVGAGTSVSVQVGPPPVTRALIVPVMSVSFGVVGGSRVPASPQARYSSSVTCSSQVVEAAGSSAMSSIARCSMKLSGEAPCQCSSSGGQ